MGKAEVLIAFFTAQFIIEISQASLLKDELEKEGRMTRDYENQVRDSLRDLNHTWDMVGCV